MVVIRRKKLLEPVSPFAAMLHTESRCLDIIWLGRGRACVGDFSGLSRVASLRGAGSSSAPIGDRS